MLAPTSERVFKLCLPCMTCGRLACQRDVEYEALKVDGVDVGGREASTGLGECPETAGLWSLAEMPRSTNKSAHYLIEEKPAERTQSWTTQSERVSCILAEA